ncbi:7-deoxyloganetic acid glucosyltransferase-like [Dorcoceras hygrometricum]|uniref:Glycosyltransferase n=1 Tax=Dorcoceras hygrometricum TaxID=472368 RepID=A0A2Z7DFD0_9LAMI|nr:7-deoxyloganetic acid glucosyltransferase-like [Dorcoceras hygrometricum]
MNNRSAKISALPHVFIFPLPLQGPVNCMLKLAQLLSQQDIRVTFLNTQHIHQRLLNCTDHTNHFKRYANLRFETLPDGLPEENPRTGDQIVNLLASVEIVAAPIFRQMVTAGDYGPESEAPVTCIIADGIFTFAHGVAAEIGVPLLYFDTISPCGLWSYICLPKLIEAGELPFRDDNLDEMIINTPGMEGILRRRDLPSFCRAKDLDDPVLKVILKEDEHIPLAQGLIFNTFQELEGPILSQMSNICPNIYAIGPLTVIENARFEVETTMSSTSIWKEDMSCISWLDVQPARSVVYVSIGSLVIVTKEDFLELWHGLVNSGSRFLWVQRQGSVIGGLKGLETPVELAQWTKERGYIVSWAPQQQVLAHPAVGAFFTHSGWNSTLESIVAGKPMICWPYGVDQQVNSRYVEQVWKLGLDMKDMCDRVVIERMIKEVMGSRKDEFLERAGRLAKLAKASVEEGGSSFRDLDRLVDDIKSMRIQAASGQN